MIDKCQCGVEPQVREILSSNHGRGHAVICSAAHWGPWAKTQAGAIRLWNKWQRTGLTAEEIEDAISFGQTTEEAMKDKSR